MITSEKIKDLRFKTGAGMLDCKKALEAMDGDLEKSVDWLRKKGVNTAQKKSSRSASEGLITINIKDKKASIIEINSETDFVARNDDFINFCNKISNIVLEKGVKNLDELLDLPFSENSNVNQELTAMISKIGENIILKRIKFFEDEDCYLQKYLHNSVNGESGKIGVLLAYDSNKELIEINDITKNICMHIAAMDPKSISKEDLDENIKVRENKIFRDQIKDSGKPDEIINKILIGKMNKFFDEVCLLEQFFVIENKVKVKDYIKTFEKKYDCKLVIKDFILFKVGEIT